MTLASSGTAACTQHEGAGADQCQRSQAHNAGCTSLSQARAAALTLVSGALGLQRITSDLTRQWGNGYRRGC